MSAREKKIRKLERSTKLMIWMAGKSSRNKTFLDKLCRRLVSKATAVKPENDFLRDPLVDNDLGFDPDELERFQRGD